jgi:transcriptional regulator with XRE-family HTH domain|nr:MAG TPA: Repressor protein CI [Caudoviricetes sp.]
MSDTFGKRLQKALADKNMKQVDLANATGFSKGRISQWVHDKHIPDADGLNQIAKALDVSETWLMGHDTPKHYDREQLEMKYQVCDLFQKCYGKEAYKAVYNFLQLDAVDQGKVIERINVLLESEKYSDSEKRDNAKMA